MPAVPFWRQLSCYCEGAILALLQCRHSGRTLVAAVTHLWFDPRVPHIKVGQAHLLCQAVSQFASEAAAEADVAAGGGCAGAGGGGGGGAGDVPVVICGGERSTAAVGPAPASSCRQANTAGLPDF